MFTTTFETDTMEFINRLGAPNVEAIDLSLDDENYAGDLYGTTGIESTETGTEKDVRSGHANRLI